MQKIKSVVYSRTSTNLSEQDTSYEQQLLYKDSRFDIIERLGERASAFKNFRKRKVLQNILYDMGIDIKEVDKQIIFVPSKRESKFKCIVCANTSRLSRNLLECKMMLKAIHQKGCKVFFIDMNKFSDESDFELVLTILQSLDEEYSKQTGFKIKQGTKRVKDSQNIIVVSNKWFGWNYIESENRLKANEFEAKIIREVFELYSQGKGCRRIVEKLNEKYDKNFDKSNVLRWIRRKEYIGEHPNSNDIYEKNSRIDPLIEEELFYKCQVILNSKKKEAGAKKYNISGKIHCQCGGNFTRRTGRYGKFNYKCSNRINKKGCKNGFITFDYINRYIYNCIKEDRNRLALDFMEISGRYRESNISKYEEEIRQIDKKIKNLMDYVVEGIISKDAYKIKEKELLEKKEVLLSKIEGGKDINNKLDRIADIQETFLEKLNNYENLYKEGKFEELHLMVESIEAYEFLSEKVDGEIEIEAKLTNLKWIEFKEVYEFLEQEIKPYQLNLIS
ncbi:MAG: recombinase family protein [Sarcina sp.]